MEQEKWMTIKEVAQKLSCDENTVQSLIQGLPSAFHNTHGAIIHSEDLDIFLKIIKSILVDSDKNIVFPDQKNNPSQKNNDQKRRLKKDGFITGKEAAELLGFFPNQVKALVLQGELPGYTFAKGCYVDPAGVEIYKQNLIKKSEEKSLLKDSDSESTNQIVPKGKESNLKNPDLEKNNNSLKAVKEKEFFEPRPNESELKDSKLTTNPISLIPDSDQEISKDLDKVISIKARKGKNNGQKVCSLEDLALAASVSLSTVKRWIDDKKIQTVEIPDNKSSPFDQRMETFVTIDSLRIFMAQYRQTRITLIERVHFPENI